MIAVDGCRIRIPLLGWVRMLEPLRFNGAIKTATVSRIAIEDLNVKGMMSNHRLARHLADASFGEFKRQLLYKGGAAWGAGGRGGPVVSVVEDLFGLWSSVPRAEALGAELDLRGVRRGA